MESAGHLGGGDDVWNVARSTLSGQANWTALSLGVVGTAKTAVISAIKRQYLYNDYFAGGLGLMLLGVVVNFFRSHWAKLWVYLTRRRGLYVVFIKPEEQAFIWLQEWLSEHANKDSTQLTLQSKWEPQPDDGAGDYDDVHGFRRDAQARPKLLFIPQLLEAQTIVFQGHKIIFQIQKQTGPANRGEPDHGDLAALLSSAGGKEQLVVEGPSRDVLEALIHEAMEAFFAKEDGQRKTAIKRWSAQEHYWNQLAHRVARPMDSVILDCDVAALVEDARQFLGSAKWYGERGIPHRRGYVLHGPPGCGKTSLIQALAGELGLDVAMIGLSSREMSDDMVHTAMNRCDPHSILVLEDVDAAFTQRNDGNEKSNSLSFSGLLNAIDGISAQEGRLLVMTTNHLERLDPALVRPGRVDLRLFLGKTSRNQAERMFRRFYPQASAADAAAFSARVPEQHISPASLQGYFLLHRDDAATALACVADLLAQQEEEERRVKASAPAPASPSAPAADEEAEEKPVAPAPAATNIEVDNGKAAPGVAPPVDGDDAGGSGSRGGSGLTEEEREATDSASVTDQSGTPDGHAADVGVVLQDEPAFLSHRGSGTRRRRGRGGRSRWVAKPAG